MSNKKSLYLSIDDIKDCSSIEFNLENINNPMELVAILEMAKVAAYESIISTNMNFRPDSNPKKKKKKDDNDSLDNFSWLNKNK